MKKNSFLILFILSAFSFSLYPQSLFKNQRYCKDDRDVECWEITFQLARNLFYVKNYSLSISKYLEVIEEKPSFYDAKIELANIHLFLKHDRAALEILKSVPLSKIDFSTRLLLACLYIKEEKYYKKAVKIYRMHIAKYPNDLKIRYQLASIYIKLGWGKDAAYEYRRILEKRPDDIPLRRAYAVLLLKLNEYKKSKKELKKTL